MCSEKSSTNDLINVLATARRARKTIPVYSVYNFDSGAEESVTMSTNQLENEIPWHGRIMGITGEKKAIVAKGSKGRIPDILKVKGINMNVVSIAKLDELGISILFHKGYVYEMLWEPDGYNYKTRVIGWKSRNQWVVADEFWDHQSADPTGTTINKEIEIATVHINALNRDQDISIGASDYLPLNMLSMIHRRWGCISKEKLLAALDRGTIKGLDGITTEMVETFYHKSNQCTCYGCAQKQKKSASTNRKKRVPRSRKSEYRKIGYNEYEDEKYTNWWATDTVDMSHSESANGVKYHQVFIHLQTRKVLTYAMRTKSEYPEKLKEFLIDYKALYPDRDKPELKVINDIIEMIDIGGPSLLRAAGKNFRYITPIMDIKDYKKLISNLKKNNGVTDFSFRKKMAHKIYKGTSGYDKIISDWLDESKK